MTQSNPGGPTPLSVTGPATVQTVLPRQTPLVLGIFGPDQHLSALIRLPNGRTRKVHSGDRLNGRTILAIDPHGLVTTKGGHQERLTLP